LIDGLKTSTAQWKFVASSVPITIPTGWPETAPRDGWASGSGEDGFERELTAIFAALAQARVRNLIWLTADVHFATGFELRPLPEHPDFSTVEWVVGPMSAGVFPNETMDPTFRPRRLFMYAPDEPPASLDEALAWYNFGEATVEKSGQLTLRVVNGRGKTMAEMKIAPR
ncbi:MAG: alkaline phosphatase D family protein, partial [Pseudomonadota bacterium]